MRIILFAKGLDEFTNVNYYINTKKFTNVNLKRKGGNRMEQKYMMDVNDVIKELGVSKSKAYQILRKLNQSLEEEGYQAIAGKIPRPYWETKFYGYTQMAG